MRRSGLYAALRARGALVGLIAVEADQTDSFGQQQAEIVSHVFLMRRGRRVPGKPPLAQLEAILPFESKRP